MIYKTLIFILILFSLKPPLNNIYDILIVFILILVILSTKRLEMTDIVRNKLFFLLSLVILLILFIIPKNYYEEGHQVFINDNDLNIIKKILPNKIFTKIEEDFNNKFDFQRLYLSKDKKWTLKFSENWFKEQRFINSPFAFSVDNFFSRSSYTRSVEKINFSSREELKIGQINKLKYNFFNDKDFRRSLPYFVFFEIPLIAKDSKICSNKSFYYTFKNKKLSIDEINKTNFEEFHNKCLEYNSNANFLYLIAYSINLEDNLKLKLKENKKLIFLKFLKYCFFILIILCYLYLFIKKEYFQDLYIYLASVLSTLILFFIRDINIILGLRYYRGGGDGLLHYSHGRTIVEDLFNFNYWDALRGGEDIFYFMPGLRYFSATSNFLFGETSYGYLILISFLPFIIFKMLKLFINYRWSIILFISFIFFPIFENMGFGYFNYVWQIARYHAEPLSILFILLSLYIVIKDGSKISFFNCLFITLLLSLSTFARPNFFPTACILSFYLVIISFQQKRYFNNISILMGFSFSFLALLHNIYFGQSFNLFTISNAHFAFSDYILNLNLQDIISSKIFLQFYKWNPPFYIHRLIFLVIVTYFIIRNRQSLITYSIFFCCISQHGVLILTHPDSRYAYLAWLLTLILFIKIANDHNFIRFLNLKFIFKKNLKLD
tara:strand:- start:1561 stop:3552 length:1992 start_codon:yes stop_codon:yes gene_type:complete